MTATLLPPQAAAPPESAAAPAGPRWVRPAVLALLLGTAVLYLGGLSASGYANSFYSAAAQAGSVSWKALFFGSSDAGNSVTVDKPPAALWVMGISVRLFGLSSWSILVPQALMGVGTVGLLFATIRRQFGPVAGLLAGAALALTPVAALMFRFDNPDALLVLLMVAAVATLLRAVEDGRTRWLVATGALIGFGFLTKQLQVFLVLPALSLTYLVAGPVRLRRRLAQLVAGLAAIVVSAGWWVAVVELWPAASRPFIGGSQTNSILELTFGYNGFGRLTGEETGSVVGGGTTGAGSWGATGIGRLVTAEFAGQIAWLAPAAVLLGIAAAALRGRAARTDPRRAALVMWGLWLAVTWLTFSFMSGIFHAYYTVALAPAVAALVGAGAVQLWERRRTGWVPVALAVTTAVSAVWSFVLLGRSSDFVPWLRWVVLVFGVAAAAGFFATRVLPRRMLLGVAAAAVLAGLAGPAAYTLQTVGSAHTGSIVTAGPTVASSMGGAMGGGGMGGGMGGGPGGGTGGGPGGGGAAPTGAQQGTAPTGTAPTAGGAVGGGTRAGGSTQAGGGAGLLNATTPGANLTALLESDAGSYRWVAATTGSNSASGYQLATQDPVMPIGGFNGTDPTPTLAQFQAFVAAHEIHYYLASDTAGGSTSSGTATDISSWVAANFTATTVDGVTVYDLTS